MAENEKTQHQIIAEARLKEKSPAEKLQEIRANLKGKGDNCRCMPAFTCLYCSRQINAYHERKKAEEEVALKQKKPESSDVGVDA